MFKGLVLAKFFLAPFANVYNIVRKMKSKEYKENQSRFSFNKKKKKRKHHSEWKFETIILKHSCTSHIYRGGSRQHTNI